MNDSLAHKFMYPPPLPAISQLPYFSFLAISKYSQRNVASRFMEWNVKDCSHQLILKDSDLLEFSGNSRPESACIRTTLPLDSFFSIFYWEITIIQSSSPSSPIAIGLSLGDNPLNRFPGWEHGSYGYHGDDGHIFASAGIGTLYGPTFGNPGDTIGCIVTFSNPIDKEKSSSLIASVRYTKNGQLLPIAFTINWDCPYYPTIGLRIPGDSLVTNFGSKPFIFDISGFIQDRKDLLNCHIKSMSCSTLFALLPEFVCEFLVYFGYNCTLSSFAEGFKNRHSNSDLFAYALPIVKQVQQRQNLESLVEIGDISKVISTLNEISGFLHSHPDLYFDLKCQQFIELIRFYFEGSNTSDDITSLLSAAQYLADIYYEHKLPPSKLSILRLIFSLFLFIGKKTRTQLSQPLENLFIEENRLFLSKKVLQNLIKYLGEKPYSNIEMILYQSYIMLEEMHSRANVFPSSLLIALKDFI